MAFKIIFRTEKNRRMNKKGVSIPIAILTVLIIALVVFSIYYLNFREKNIRGIVDSSKIMDDFAIKDILLDYYLQTVFENAAGEMKFSDGKNVFISRFKQELENYKDEKGNYFVEELKIAEEQAVEDNIGIDSENLIFNLNVQISRSFEKISVDYIYEKEFVKVLG